MAVLGGNALAGSVSVTPGGGASAARRKRMGREIARSGGDSGNDDS
jgi:hypothetical protein